MKVMETEEKSLREKNLQLQRKLQMEIERREALHRHLSESESSLEMDEERLAYLNPSYSNYYIYLILIVLIINF